MSVERIRQLERQIANLQRDVRQLQSYGGSATRRNPRIALTVPNYLASPQYPAEPGEGDDTPKIFPFVFADAMYGDAAGTELATYTNRQNIVGATNSRTYFSHVYNLCERYLPQYTLIEIFEDNGKYWTAWNNSSGGGSSSGSTYIHVGQATFTSYPSTSTSVQMSLTGSGDALSKFDLAYNSSSKLIETTAPTSFLIVAYSTVSTSGPVSFINARVNIVLTNIGEVGGLGNHGVTGSGMQSRLFFYQPNGYTSYVFQSASRPVWWNSSFGFELRGDKTDINNVTTALDATVLINTRFMLIKGVS